MGYRSCGAIFLSPLAMNLLKTKESNKVLIDDLVTFDSNHYEGFNAHKGKTGQVFSFSYWKWYESYPEVQAWENFFDYCDEHKIAYDFIRIGEDGDDYEVRTQLVFRYVRDFDVVYDEWCDDYDWEEE